MGGIEMNKKSAKLWAHYETIKLIVVDYIVIFLAALIVAPCISALVHSEEIDAGVHNAVSDAVLLGLQWFAIIIAVITVVCIVWFICYSDRVAITDTEIKYYRWIWSKKSVNVSHEDIAKVIFSNGRWRYEGRYIHGRKIFIFHNNQIIFKFDIYYKLCMAIVMSVSNIVIRLVDNNGHLKAIGNYFDIDFVNLSYNQQLEILKYYCKFVYSKYRTGEEILKKKKLL